jgi:hypothetical protein
LGGYRNEKIASSDGYEKNVWQKGEKKVHKRAHSVLMIEQIPNRPQTSEENRSFGVLFKIFPEPDDKVINSPRARLAGIPPTDLKQFITGQRLSPVRNKKLQNLYLLFGK